MSASAPAAALRNLRRATSPTVGLLIGQTTNSNYEIIYVARTQGDKNVEETKDNISTEENISSIQSECRDKNITNISDVLIAEHAKYIIRMLPGGIYILGIFVVCPEDIFNDKVLLEKVKSMLLAIDKVLSANKYMCSTPSFNERLIMHYADGKVICKSVDITNISNGALKSVDINFKANMRNWQQIDCYYQFDELFPVISKKTGISVREQFLQILESAYQSVQSSLVFLDGKLRPGMDTLDSLCKRKKGKKSKENDTDILPPIQASMFLPCESKIPDSVEYLECEGTTHFSGVVASRIYLNSKASIDDATTALKQDIIRSLASRFTMHCDALISDSLLPEEKMCFNEPPRRVLIKLPDLEDGHIFFSDYLFPGESPDEALTSVKEMLDVNITEDDVISNVETPADISEFVAFENKPNGEESLTVQSDTGRLVYLLVAGLSIIAVIVAVFFHYWIN